MINPAPSEYVEPPDRIERPPLWIQGRIFFAGLIPTFTIIAFLVVFVFSKVKVKKGQEQAAALAGTAGLVIMLMMFLVFIICVFGMIACFVPWKSRWTALLGGFAISFAGIGAGYLLIPVVLKILF